MPQKFPPVIYRVLFSGGEPVKLRPELEETQPRHADMLRYDLAFHCPDDPSLIVFPWFRHSTDGTYSRNITGQRWRSYGLRIESAGDENAALEIVTKQPVGDWVGYHHPQVNGKTDYSSIATVTLDAWLKAHTKTSLHGWRTI